MVDKMLRIGIAISTFNRREMVCAQVDELRRLTGGAYHLVVCDDGSSDGTQEALLRRDVTIICGVNRGVAWNKNRGIFYLMAVCGCDVAILLDDDVMPRAAGWQERWVEGATRWGMVNFIHPTLIPDALDTDCTAERPGLIPKLLGACIAFHRFPWSLVGYMDPRFGRYGHEHTEFTNRFLHNGYGGREVDNDGVAVCQYYVIGGGIELLPAIGNGTQSDIEANTGVWLRINDEAPHTFRAPWRDERQRVEFLAELRLAIRQNGVMTPQPWEAAAFRAG